MDNPNLFALGAQPVTPADTAFKAIFNADKRPWLVVLLLAIAINIAGIATDFFTNDPGLYGLLAKNMVQTHNYTDLIYRGKDWLDKPHFPFWMAALSFNVFGFTTFAYKLPALLFYFMAVVYTYKLTKKFYGFDTALIAALVLLTAQHTVMSNTDVRAEPYIMGLLMGSVYHFYKVKQNFSIAHLLLATLFAGCAVMTKGIYVLIPIGTAIIGDYLLKKDFKGLFQWRWLFAVILTVIFILPEIYTLYVQFDLHPEKVVFNHTGVSGIHWFLWDSQFGRFNSTSYITRVDGDKFFFVHTLLWAFAPWAFLFYIALFLNIRKIVKGTQLPEYVALSGALPMLLIFSVSQFQLPFYTNILFPFFAMITAVYIKQVFDEGKSKLFTIIQQVIWLALVLLIVALVFVYGGHNIMFFAATALVVLYAGAYAKKTLGGVKFVFLNTCCVAVLINLFIITVVYPELLRYKGEVQAAKYLNTHLKADKLVIAAFEVPDPFEFYAKRRLTFINLDSAIATKNKNTVVLVEDTLVAHLIKQRIPFKVLQKFNNYPNENLSLPFLMETQRYKTLNHYFLITL
ncbi:4-amino-4-deoxy-L-arabinose transferase-like glycosyltransferase [Mucilaginibacter gracilis]|uniref:4-amino-4-deoxy-L-arabinose transferase-like glycosyltransferase n=1 Tax=Mucilaginibacter gracilis TaxID=423350 RepID=A0A495IY70_9SPHI|nr:glycosyltransferase family 39 protein [Mucilaginibacter gracilis]RKR81650.1 4-amino-4-deoxy-L-arabinose transferase-like glycosyltransferase [Mucilaginibacter gracilis]